MTTSIAAAVSRLLILALVALLALTVWPTRWRHDHISLAGETYPVRIDRFTSDADVLLPGEGWVPIEELVEDEGTVPGGPHS
ncbi:MAG: hypothetical protein MUC84_11865 [Solirubrobacteraceae bacterium]|nr:hypothetical protein [Solirubrobacteraceae bacterium]